MNSDSSDEASEITRILSEAQAGNRTAVDRLLDLVYERLHALAERFLRAERPDHTLQPTALVHEAYMQLVDQKRVNWQGRTHFFAVGAAAMRRILVDHARRHRAAKRGGGQHRMALDEDMVAGQQRSRDVLAVDEALEKLSRVDPLQAKLVELRFFGGLTVSQAAEVLKVSTRTLEREWTMVRAWLRRELAGNDTS